jgi:hypothetical protein
LSVNLNNPAMELDYYVQICARNSRGHRQESEFIDWLTGEIEEIMQDEEFDLKLLQVVKKSDWRDILLESNSGKLDSMLDRLEDILRDSITIVGECIATVDYDHEGMAHSGSNSVYELCGVYWLEGSDFIEGPTEDKYELLGYLDKENPDHDVFWSEYAD